MDSSSSRKHETETESILRKILANLSDTEYISSDSIPDIDLYMDQVTTFMDERLDSERRYPEDKTLTKTMINNYTKGHLLPPPEKKKYSRNHLLLMLFIYYLKDFLSISDIEIILNRLNNCVASPEKKSDVKDHISEEKTCSLKDIYDEIFLLENSQLSALKQDINRKYAIAAKTFMEADEDDQEQLHLFSFLCLLCFDVYQKKKMIETIVDHMERNDPPSDDKRQKKNR